MKKTILATMLLTLLSTVALADRGDNPREVGERLRGDAVRSENRGDHERAREARDAASRAEHSTPDRARDIERSYNRGERSDRGGRDPAGKN